MSGRLLGLASALGVGLACGHAPPQQTLRATMPPPTGPLAPSSSRVANPAADPTATLLASLPPSSGPTGGVDLSLMNPQASPCADFFAYACGGWLARTAIPADRPSWGLISVVEEEIEGELRTILERDARGEGDPADPYAKQAGDLYAACMDEAAIEKEGVTPLAAELEPALAVIDTASLERAIAHYQAERIDVLFTLGAEQDARNAEETIAYVDQGGLGLPDRDYYLSADPALRSVRDGYRAHVARLLVLSGLDAKAAAAGAGDVLALETELARVSLSKTEQRDPYKTYHRLNLSGLQELAADFAWADLLANLGLGPAVASAIDVKDLGFFAGLQRIVQSSPPSTWRAYLRYHVAATMAPTLPRRFTAEALRLQTLLTGVEREPPRWKRCVEAVDRAIGMAPGRSFVHESFGPRRRALARALVETVDEAMATDLRSLPWMDEPTRARALAKLTLVDNLVGYPDVWRRYDGLDIARSGYALDVRRAAAFELRRELAKIGKPRDRSDWDMTPQTVNAYYDPAMNQLVLPAGILQPPFFGRDLGLPVDYGATAASTMGHELTHGFDDEGRQYDGRGDFLDWWTPEAARRWNERTACVAHQYDGYTIAGVHLDGELELGENIADIGGVKLGWMAFRALLASAQPPPPADTVAGLTPSQQFFVAYGQSWCDERRDAYARMEVTADPHAPERFRVNGPLADLPAFAEAFSCPAGAPMAPTTRCEVW